MLNIVFYQFERYLGFNLRQDKLKKLQALAQRYSVTFYE